MDLLLIIPNDTLLTNRVTLDKMVIPSQKVSILLSKVKFIKFGGNTCKKTTAYLYTYDKKGNRTSYTYQRQGTTKLSIKYA